jgi:hypothetical protein
VSVSLLSRRGRRIARLAAAPSAVCAALILACVVPAAAQASCAAASGGSSGAVCSFSLTPLPPSSTQAGGDPSIASSVSFNYGTSTTDSVKSLSITLPPGLFASLGAVTQLCTTAQLTSLVPQCPPASQIGTGSLTTSLAPKIPFNVSLYMMPAPQTADAAGVGVVVRTPQGLPVTTTTGTVSEQEINGNPQLILSLPALPNSVGALSIQVTSLSFTINGTAATATGAPSATPFTRLPTSCATATSTLSVQTYAATSPNGASSSSFTPTGCSSLTFTPSMTATATRDASDPGVTLVTTVTTNPSQAANKSLVLTVPTGTLAPDVFNAGHLFNQVIGSATAATPLVTAPLVGTVTLTGTISAPALTITFPPPFSLQFSGAINIVANSVTFSTIPDVPLSSLTLTLQGNATSLFYTTCSQPNGTLQAAFGGQNGATSTVSTPLVITGCPPAVLATVSSVSANGLKQGSAKLAFSLAAGTGAPNLKSFTVSLPSGLQFNKTTYRKGLSVSGAKIKNASLSGGKLAVTLKSGVSQLSVKLSAKALIESSALRTKIKNKKVKSLTATVVAKNTSGKTLTLKLKLNV